MIYIILDLEATCWEGKPEGPNEIIEIGAVCVNHEKQILGEFVSFVKPSAKPILSDFCKQLTSIMQEQVNQAPYFTQAVQSFQNWFLEYDSQYLLCSWGMYDQSQLEKDCKRHGIDTAWLQAHISLKHQYPLITGRNKMVGMKGALGIEGIELTGTHHRGIDDARNITKIFLKHFEKWKTSSNQ